MALGCQGVSPETLTKPESKNTVHLAKNIEWEVTRGNVISRYVLASGGYALAGRDTNGDYYVGNPPCFFEGHISSGKNAHGWRHACGIYFKNNATLPQVFVFSDSGVVHNAFSVDGLPRIGNETMEGEPALQLPSDIVLQLGLLPVVFIELSRGNYMFIKDQPPSDRWNIISEP